MHIKPVLQSVYVRNCDTTLSSDVSEVLMDVNDADLAPIVGSSAYAQEDIVRAFLNAAAETLLEDAVARLRLKSFVASQLEGIGEGRGAEKTRRSVESSWRARDQSWRMRSVLKAMEMPREVSHIPDAVYWGAVIVDVCEKAVLQAGSRHLVAAAVLRNLSQHESMLDNSIVQLAYTGKGTSPTAASLLRMLPAQSIPESLHLAEPSPEDVLKALQRGTLSYHPPDTRRLDGEVLTLTRKLLLRNLGDLRSTLRSPDPLRSPGSLLAITTPLPREEPDNPLLRQLIRENPHPTPAVLGPTSDANVTPADAAARPASTLPPSPAAPAASWKAHERSELGRGNAERSEGVSMAPAPPAAATPSAAAQPPAATSPFAPAQPSADAQPPAAAAPFAPATPSATATADRDYLMSLANDII